MCYVSAHQSPIYIHGRTHNVAMGLQSGAVTTNYLGSNLYFCVALLGKRDGCACLETMTLN